MTVTDKMHLNGSSQQNQLLALNGKRQGGVLYEGHSPQALPKSHDSQSLNADVSFDTEPQTLRRRITEATEAALASEQRLTLPTLNAQRRLSLPTLSTQSVQQLSQSLPLRVNQHTLSCSETEINQRKTTPVPQFPCPFQSPPDSNIANLWPEVLQLLSENDMASRVNTKSHTTAHTAAAFDNPNVVVGKPYDIPDGSSIEAVCKHLKVDNVVLQLPSMHEEHAQDCAGTFENWTPRSQVDLEAQLRAFLFPKPYIKNVQAEGQSRDLHSPQTMFALDEIPPDPFAPESRTLITQPSSPDFGISQNASTSPTPNAAPRNLKTPRILRTLIQQEPLASEMVISREERSQTPTGIQFGLAIGQSFQQKVPRHIFKKLEHPCLNVESDICAPFLTVLCGKDVDKQWANVAKATLSEILTLRRYSEDDPKKDTAALVRHYGYLVWEMKISIWEMSCKLQDVGVERSASKSPTHSRQRSLSISHPLSKVSSTNAASSIARMTQAVGNKSYWGRSTGEPSSQKDPKLAILQPQFEIRRVSIIELQAAKDVLRFDQYHRAILAWGMGKYCLSYARNLHTTNWLNEVDFKGSMTPEDAYEYWKDVVQFEKRVPE